MAVALLVAAGRGERLGFDRPKALVPVAGRPMVEWSLQALRAVASVQTIVIALPSATVAAPPAGADIITVAGGATRSASVRAALAAAPGGDVIVHDAARPLATPALFERALAELAAHDCDAVVAATPVPDTIKAVGDDGHTVVRTLDRSRLWAIQTPQVFRRAALERAVADATDELLAAATDDAWLVEQAGGTVRVVPGDPGNIKVTSPADLRLAELIISERER